MEEKEGLYMERLFNKLNENWDLRHEISAFSRYLKTHDWVMLRGLPENYKELKKTEIVRHVKKVIDSPKELRKELMKILKAVRGSRKNRAVERFHYGRKMHGISYPLMYEDVICGFIVLCSLKKQMSSDLLNIFASFTDTVIRESIKELELEDLNKTIRPRAIALSTVHTVHRLMTATLDLSELLPRIARLSLQVLRANRCSIKLVDSKGKLLLPMTTIDLRKDKALLKKVQIGKYAPGRAVKKGTPIRGRNYLAVPMIDEDVVGVITIYDKLDRKEFKAFDEEIMKTLAEQAVIAIKNAQLFKEQADLTLSSIKCIARLLENRPHGIHRPEASLQKLINIICPKINMNESEIKMLQYAAMLHDAGQISIPEEVLMKRGELTGYEYDIVKTHPMKGASILSKFRPLKPIVPIILYHHENWDGTGYPKGLKEREIPLPARVLAVIVAFEAMITEKPYRKALSINAAVKEVRKNAGTQFDPGIVEIFYEAVHRKDVRRLLEKELGKK
ncbi:MAG: HD domain-containing phosphohydrolase [Candidatus Omnitrophota bacterium]|nr:HD domain-containing phosphohydrolase [Candidatus Omnitrophota bacterium]